MQNTPRSLVSLAFRIRKFEIITFLALTVILGSIVVVQGGQASRLERDGVTVEASVTNVEQRVVFREGERRHERMTTWSFVAEDGETYTRRFVTPLRSETQVLQDAQWQIGDTTQLRYLRDNPRVSDLYEGESAKQAKGGLIFSGAAFLGLLGFFGAGLWRARNGITAREQGQRLELPVSRPPDGLKPHELRSIFWVTSSGNYGRSLPFGRNAKRPQPGERIVVYDHEGESWWEGDTGPREAVR